MTMTEHQAPSAPGPLMASAGSRRPSILPWTRSRQAGGNPPPPREPRLRGGHRPPHCDKCHIAEAKYEVVISEALKQFLYFCAHHMQKLWAEMRSRGYDIRKL